MRKTILIGFIGKPGHGKDTACNFLVKNRQFFRFAFADELKRVAKDLFDLSEAQVVDPDKKEFVDLRYDKTPRQILQLLGTEIGRLIDPNIWVRKLDRAIFMKRNQHLNHSVCISDVRFSNEIQWLKNSGGFLIKVVRPGYQPPGYDEKSANHSSNRLTDSEQSDADLILQNDGDLDRFYKKIENELIPFIESKSKFY